MTTAQILATARKHLGNGAAMESSARLCMASAVEMLDAGNDEAARTWAMRSLRYSVGIMHPEYVRADSTV